MATSQRSRFAARTTSDGELDVALNQSKGARLPSPFSRIFVGLRQGVTPSAMQKARQCAPAFCMSDGAELNRQEAGERRKIRLETIVSPPHTSPDKPVQ